MPWFKHHPGPGSWLGDRCASHNCEGRPTWRLEVGGVGSFYCHDCMEKIEGDPHWQAMHGGCPRCEADDILDRLRAYNGEIGGGPGVITNAIGEIEMLRTLWKDAVDDKHAWAAREVRAEREVCAMIADDWAKREDRMTDTSFVPGADHGERFASKGIADAIRNRK